MAVPEFLTPAEQEWLHTHRGQVVIGSDSSYYPYLFYDDKGVLTGIWGDLLQRLEKDLEFTFRRQRYPNFQTVLDAAKSREIGFIACIIQSPDREAFLSFTEPFHVVEDMIITRKNSRISNIDDLKGQRIGVVQGYAVEEQLQQKAPSLTLFPVLSEEDGLRKLIFGELDVLIADMGVAAWYTREMNLTDVRAAGPLGIDISPLSFGVRNDWPELTSILNKAMNQIPSEERQAILEKWAPLGSSLDLRRIGIGLAIASGLMGGFLVIVLFWNRSLRRLVAKRTQELETELLERLRAQSDHARLAAAMSEIEEHIMIADAQRQIEYINPRFVQDTEIQLEEIVGKPLDQIIRLQDVADLTSIWNHLAGERVWRGKLQLPGIRNRDVPLEVEATVATIQDENGHTSGYVLCGRDRSHEEALENQLQQVERIRSIGVLAGGIAHDFNNLLTPIVAGIELVQLEDLSDNAHRLLSSVNQASLRAKDLVAQILTFSSSESGSFRPVDFVLLTKQSISLLRSSLTANVDIKADIPDKFPLLNGDSAQLQSVIINLGTNAFHALETSGGTLEIALKKHDIRPEEARSQPILSAGCYAILIVRDNGTGIPTDVVDRIFDPYFTTKPEGKGTGLGLSTAQGIVRSHGGDIQVRSSPESGTVFHVYLPLEETSATDPPKEEPQNERPKGHGECVLLVDDDLGVLRAHTAFLKRLGYEVVTSENADAAYKLFCTNPESFDVILTDFSMPGKNGLELLQNCRAINPEQRGVLITGGGYGLAETEFLVLRKPVRLTELAKRMRQALEGHQSLTQS